VVTVSFCRLGATSSNFEQQTKRASVLVIVMWVVTDYELAWESTVSDADQSTLGLPGHNSRAEVVAGNDRLRMES